MAKNPGTVVKGGTQKAAGISDRAVHTKTGKRWDEWFAILDEAGAKKWSHSQIAAYLYDSLEVPAWWNQMVAVAYEQERGLRPKPQARQTSLRRAMRK